MKGALAEQIAQPREIALYQGLEGGYFFVMSVNYATYDEQFKSLPEGARRELPMKGYMRVSEPMQVSFEPCSNDAALRSAIESLSAAEREIVEELGKKLAQIRGQKAQLLALTHSPEAA